MRVAVVDDQLIFEESIAFALGAMDAPGSAHQVTGARSPADLAELLRTEGFDLAFVDLNFGRRIRESGLTALRLLAERGIPAIVYWSDTEDNRALYLLAAFQFFRPVAQVPKSSSSQEIREIVDALAGGQPLPTPTPLPMPAPVSTPRPAPPGHRPTPDGPSLLDRLIASTDDLLIWQALAIFSGRVEVARAANFSPRRIDNFLRDRFEAMLDVQRELLDPRLARTSGEDGRGLDPPDLRQTRLTPMHAFAREHAAFFHDPEVARLIARRAASARARDRPAGRPGESAGRRPGRRRGRE